jgi:glyoxylase I family protein
MHATRELAERAEAETYLGEKFVKQIPKDKGAWQHVDIRQPSPIKIERLDHSALEVTDVEKSIKFYTGVLGFQQFTRPNFPFGGAWLKAGNSMLHLIERDPSVERKIGDWKDKYEKEPECWYIRRSEHQAFQVSDLDTAEEALLQMGVEYHKFLVPGTNCAQIFLYDPDGNGIELGSNYGEVAKLIKEQGSQ